MSSSFLIHIHYSGTQSFFMGLSLEYFFFDSSGLNKNGYQKLVSFWKNTLTDKNL